MTTTEKIQELFRTQLSGHALALSEILKEKFGELEGFDITVQEYLAEANLNLNMDGKTPNSKTPKVRTKKVKPIEDLCQARVWGEKHDGTEQCSFIARSNGLCAKHSKAEELCCVPCTLDENGKRKGLWMGRITQYQEGEPGIAPYKNADGVLCIAWTSGTMKQHIAKALEEGTCLHAKKPKRSAKKKAISEELASAMGSPVDEASLHEPNTTTPTDQVVETSATDQVGKTSAQEMEELFGLTDDEDNGLEKPEADAIGSSAVDDEGQEQEDVEEIQYEDTLFYVGKGGTNIYNLGCDEDSEEYGKIIGQWVDDKPELYEGWKHLLWKEFL